MVEVKVASLGLDRSSNTPVVILQDLASDRVLPIWIGPGEASAIAMQLGGMSFSRPLTHDLLVSVLGGLGGELKRVIITRVEKNTYFAELIIHRNGDLLSVDARPSDSIAIALRTDARIFADDSLLEAMSPGLATVDTASADPEPAEEPGEPTLRMTPEQLKEYLRKMHPEDFGRFNM